MASEDAPASDLHHQVFSSQIHLQILYRTVPGHENVDAKGRLGLAEVFPFIAPPVRKSKFYRAFVLNRRVVLHAIDAKPAR